MSTFIDSVIARLGEPRAKIVLPEGDDERTLQAAEKLLEKGVCDLIIIGSESQIADSGYKLDKAQIVDPNFNEYTPQAADLLFELRRAKGMTEEEAHDLMGDCIYLGTMLVKMGVADGMVTGAKHATSDVLRPCLQILKTAPDAKYVSSFFVMVVPDCEYGQDGAFMFADCGLEQMPDEDKLAQIAIHSAKSWELLFGTEARVAMLSHSTLGSAAKCADNERVAAATKLAREQAPDLLIDGELQLDAAIVPSIGEAKAPGSAVAGKANVLVFPDLDAGNIGYKLVQRLAKAEAFGPITQGIAAPVNDLSRGCTADDIVGVVAITALQCQARRQA